MNGRQFVAYHLKTVLKMNAICKAKNEDYSGGGDVYAFRNFEMVETMGICQTWQGFLTRMTDKFMRIINISKTGNQAVKEESIIDSLLDLANYCILMAGRLESKKRERMEEEGIEPHDDIEPIQIPDNVTGQKELDWNLKFYINKTQFQEFVSNVQKHPIQKTKWACDVYSYKAAGSIEIAAQVDGII